MIKRYLSLALAFVILGSSLVVPASAAESDYWLNVLDYATANDSGSNRLANFQKTATATYALPFAFNAAKLDMLVYSLTPLTSVTTFGDTSLTVTQVIPNYYRIWGNLLNWSIQNLALTFNTSGFGDVSILTLKISSLSDLSLDERCQLLIAASGYSDTINYYVGDTINSRYFPTPSSDPVNQHLNLYITCANWKLYDYLEFHLYVSCNSINTVNASLDGVPIPFEVSYINNPGGYANDFNFSIRLDLRDLDRTSSGVPQIIIDGKCLPTTEDLNYVAVISCTGALSVQGFDTDIFFLRAIYRSIHGVYLYLHTWIQEQTSAIVAAIRGDTSSGDDFKEDSSGLISDLDDISGVLDSVQRPSMDNVSMDFTGNISGATSLMATTFNSFTSIPWVNTIFMASITLALISYILFGKE